MINLVIDTSVFRKHLTGSWHVLAFIGAQAHAGKVQIHIPWIIHQEILSGIKDEVEKITNPGQLGKTINQIAELSSTPDEFEELGRKIERLITQTTDEISARYIHWIESSQATIVPLTEAQSKEAWTAYFEGDTPFTSRKFREDIPDAFIYQSLLALLDECDELHFIVQDGHFREQSESNPKICVHKDIFSFCQSVSVPLDFERLRDQHRLPIEASVATEVTSLAVQKALVGLRLKIPEGFGLKSDALKIQLVRSFSSFRLESTSILPLDSTHYLAAYTATSTLQCDIIANEDDLRAKSPPVGNFSVSLTGRAVIRILNASSEDALPSEKCAAELDSVEISSIARSEDQIVVHAPIKPVVTLDAWSRNQLDKAIKLENVGLIVVAGGNRTSRKRVAEFILDERRRRSPDGHLFLLGFPSELSRQLVSSPPLAEASVDGFFLRAERSSVDGVAISEENGDWLDGALNFIINTGDLVVATMKGFNTATSVVRHLGKESGFRAVVLDHLLAVAVVTGSEKEQVQFRITTHGEWGDGSWQDTLEHYRLYEKQTPPVETVK